MILDPKFLVSAVIDRFPRRSLPEDPAEERTSSIKSPAKSLKNEEQRDANSTCDAEPSYQGSDNQFEVPITLKDLKQKGYIDIRFTLNSQGKIIGQAMAPKTVRDEPASIENLGSSHLDRLAMTPADHLRHTSVLEMKNGRLVASDEAFAEKDFYSKASSVENSSGASTITDSDEDGIDTDHSHSCEGGSCEDELSTDKDNGYESPGTSPEYQSAPNWCSSPSYTSQAGYTWRTTGRPTAWGYQNSNQANFSSSSTGVSDSRRVQMQLQVHSSTVAQPAGDDLSAREAQAPHVYPRGHTLVPMRRRGYSYRQHPYRHALDNSSTRASQPGVFRAHAQDRSYLRPTSLPTWTSIVARSPETSRLSTARLSLKHGNYTNMFRLPQQVQAATEGYFPTSNLRGSGDLPRPCSQQSSESQE